MPNPFRHYEGVPVLDLPGEPPGLSDGPAFLSALLFYSAAISATKQVPSTGYRYALRVNPSSGNLHPTEFHFATLGLRAWPDGLYHYRPSSHMAEQRARGNFGGPITFFLTSIAWREAWKYQDRAYRYCLLDMGHAWQALALSARAIGCESFATGHFADAEIARLLGTHEDEWPMLIVTLKGDSIPVRDPDAGETEWFGGHANALSEQQVPYPLIREIHASTSLLRELAPAQAFTRSGETRHFRDVARTRRSALDFAGGTKSMSPAQLSAILDFASEPLAADFAGARFIQLYLYVHRVDGLQPGVYRHGPDGLKSIEAGDQRVIAAGLSLRQDLAGNACVAFSMIADLDRAAALHGDRGYRYAHFEAGAIGHRLYLAAEAHGLRATGIGAFFDDEVHRYLNLTSGERQVVYHFAIGYPVADRRLNA